MPNYRRVKIKGGIYFLTLVTDDRREIFISPPARKILIDSITHVQKYHPFFMIAYCILPNHIHFLWEMPEDDFDYSMRIGEVKKRFSKSYFKQTGSKPFTTSALNPRGESGLWQRRFWEHYIRDEEDLYRHIDYIHYNPVKHGVVNRVRDWPSSSFFDYVNNGVYDFEWGKGYKVDDEKFNFGE